MRDEGIPLLHSQLQLLDVCVACLDDAVLFGSLAFKHRSRGRVAIDLLRAAKQPPQRCNHESAAHTILLPGARTPQRTCDKSTIMAWAASNSAVRRTTIS